MKSFCSLKSLGLIWQKTYLISPSKREFSNQLLSNFRLYQRPLKGPAYKLTLCICTCQPSKLHDVIPYDKSLCIHLFNYPFVQPYPPPTHTYTHILLIIFVWRSLTESNSRASHPLGWSLIWCMIVKRVTSISFARKQNLVKRVIFFFLSFWYTLLQDIPEFTHAMKERIIQGYCYQIIGVLGFTLRFVFQVLSTLKEQSVEQWKTLDIGHSHQLIFWALKLMSVLLWASVAWQRVLQKRRSRSAAFLGTAWWLPKGIQKLIVEDKSNAVAIWSEFSPMERYSATR